MNNSEHVFKDVRSIEAAYRNMLGPKFEYPQYIDVKRIGTALAIDRSGSSSATNQTEEV